MRAFLVGPRRPNLFSRPNVFCCCYFPDKGWRWIISALGRFLFCSSHQTFIADFLFATRMTSSEMVPGNNIFACTDCPRGRVLYACFRRMLSSVFPPSKSSRSLRVALSMLKLVQNRQAKRCGSRLAAHTQHMVARASYHIYMVHAAHTRERKRSPPIPLLALSLSVYLLLSFCLKQSCAGYWRRRLRLSVLDVLLFNWCATSFRHSQLGQICKKEDKEKRNKLLRHRFFAVKLAVNCDCSKD